MVESSIIETIKRYLSALKEYGINARKAVLYGSFARWEGHAWSDIDLIVIAPEFDRPRSVDMIKPLWLAAAHADDRIEPIPCGELEWETEQGRPILTLARKEGILVTLS